MRWFRLVAGALALIGGVNAFIQEPMNNCCRPPPSPCGCGIGIGGGFLGLPLLPPLQFPMFPPLQLPPLQLPSLPPLQLPSLPPLFNLLPNLFGCGFGNPCSHPCPAPSGCRSAPPAPQPYAAPPPPPPPSGGYAVGKK